MKENSNKVCIVGLGYVGLPLVSAILSNTSDFVYGIDTCDERCAQISLSQLPGTLSKFNNVLRNNSSRIKVSNSHQQGVIYDFVLICVPTPLYVDYTPDLRFVEFAFAGIIDNVSDETTIILESTVYPGCTEELYSKYFDGLELSPQLGFSPEREDPGNKSFTVSTTPKIISASSAAALSRISAFYRRFVDSVVPCPSIKCAELAKLLENTQRSVNISLMNELKLYTTKIGVDIYDVVNAASTKPFGFMPYYPGPGIGGHCIPIDPSYLYWSAKRIGIDLTFIQHSVSINTEISDHITNDLISICNSRQISPFSSTLLLAGLSYKKNIDDMRSSPSLPLFLGLKIHFRNIFLYDPLVTSQSLPTQYNSPNTKFIQDLDVQDISSTGQHIITLVITDHDCIDFNLLSSISTLVFDTRGRFQADSTKYFRL